MGFNPKERRAWATFKSHIKANLLKIERIENQIVDGMADTIGTNRNKVPFWMETKALHAWPKRASTLPLLSAFEKGQLPFLRGWAFWGFRTFVLLRVGKEYLLLNPKDAIDAMTREQLELHAYAIGHHAIIKYLEEMK